MGQPTQGEAAEEGGRNKESRGIDKNGDLKKGRAGPHEEGPRRMEKSTGEETAARGIMR